jgi:small conductance mechanosensitive channel
VLPNLLLRFSAPEAWLDAFTPQVVLLSAVRVAVVLALAALVLALIRRGTDRWRESVAELPATDPGRQRAITLGNLLQSMAGYVVWAIAGTTVLSEVGLGIGALIATAGIAGRAVGFGAQALVTISGHTGTIGEIGGRPTKLRTFDGEPVMIPAGEVRVFGNKSVRWARAIVPVGPSHDQGVDAILPVTEQVASEWVAEHEDIMLEESPQVQGLMDLGDSSIAARVAIRVKPGEQYAAERELRQRLKRAFDEKGIEIPLPRRTTHVVQGEALPPASESDDAVDSPSFSKLAESR